MFRIGHGYDVHRLEPGLDLWICGLKIPHTHGLLGHSDADVAIHSLCDALLGSLALGDIGKHFPDSDLRYKGIDSKKLLAEVCNLIISKGWKIGNVDITIIAEAPKFKNYIDSMRATLAEVMGIEKDNVSVKATTTEGLGFTGERKGIASHAVALVYNS